MAMQVSRGSPTNELTYFMGETVLHFSTPKRKLALRLIQVTRDEKPFATIYTYPKSKAWFVKIGKKREQTFRFVDGTRKHMALNNAMDFVNQVSEIGNRNEI